jgi:hypothetical protein
MEHESELEKLRAEQPPSAFTTQKIESMELMLKKEKTMLQMEHIKNTPSMASGQSHPNAHQHNDTK